MKNKKYRQGDVLLVQIEKLPSGLKEKDKTIALGEITGHHHRFESKQVQVFADKQGQQFVKIDKPSQLLHEEHSDIEIPRGIFKVILQREYDIMEGVRQVMD